MSIKNKSKDPKPTDFSKTDLVINVKEGKLFYIPLVEFHLKDDSKDDPLLTYDRMKLMGYDQAEFVKPALDINKIVVQIREARNKGIDLDHTTLPEYKRLAKEKFKIKDKEYTFGLSIFNHDLIPFNFAFPSLLNFNFGYVIFSVVM